MSTVTAGSKLVITRVLTSVGAFAGLAVFSRQFGGTVLGPFFLFQAILAIGGIVVDLGIRGAVEKRISEGQAPGEILSSALAIKTPLLLAGVVVVFLARGMVDSYLGANLWWLVCVGLVLRESALLSINTLRGELQVGATAVLVALRNLSWIVVGWPLANRGFGVFGPVYGWLIGFIGVILVGVLRSDSRLSRPSIEKVRSLIGYGKYRAVSNISWQVFNWTDVIVLGVFFGSTVVTAYEIAWRVSSVTLLVSSTATRAVFPHASQAAADGDQSKLRDYIKSLLVISGLILVPSLFGALVLAEQILTVGFSPSFAIAATALVILVGQSLIQSIQSVFGQILFAVNEPQLPTRATVVAFTSNIVLNLLLVPQFSLTGAAVATMVSYGLNLLIQYVYIGRVVKIVVPKRIGIVAVAASLLMYAVLRWAVVELTINSYPELFGTVLLGVMVYVLASLMSGEVRGEIKRYMRAI